MRPTVAAYNNEVSHEWSIASGLPIIQRLTTDSH
jgi:hypothetical protein